MGLITLQTPVLGNPNSTEAPKVDSNFVALSSLLNGGLDTNNLSSTAAVADSQLASSSNAARRLVFFNIGTVPSATSFVTGGQDFLVPPLGAIVASGTGTTIPVPLFPGDLSINSQPLDFNNVSGMTARCRLRGVVACNAVAASTNVTVGLYNITAVGGTGQMNYAFSTVAGTQTNTTTTGANSMNAVESPQFSLPTNNGIYSIGVNLSGGVGVTATNSFLTITVGMYLYHA